MELHPEEFGDDCRRVISTGLAKGKRTKRRCLPSPSLGGVAASTCSSSSGPAGDPDGGDAAAGVTTSVESTVVGSTEEEEDMAYCLILLAQGGSSGAGKVPDASTKPGVYVFECRTCSRVFPSFQALGGHRASHKKPRLPLVVGPAVPALLDRDIEEQDAELCKITVAPVGKAPANVVGSNKQKVHECSICGLEFGSGQALGGHMRRHRPIPTPTGSNPPESATNSNVVGARNFLRLDLNLPAPEEDRVVDSKLMLRRTQQEEQQRILLSGPTLVDCHY